MNGALIPPTVGRVVLYRPDPTQDRFPQAAGPNAQPCAALITRVWGDRCVNLTVFDADGGSHGRTSVVLAQPGDVPPPAGRYCYWMPYQIGQSRRHAAPSPSAAGPPAA